MANRIAPRITRNITRALQKSGKKEGSALLSAGGLLRVAGRRIELSVLAKLYSGVAVS